MAKNVQEENLVLEGGGGVTGPSGSQRLNKGEGRTRSARRNETGMHLLSCSLGPCLTRDKSEAEEMDEHAENQEVRTRSQVRSVSE